MNFAPQLTRTEFDALHQQGHNRIALTLQTLADLETPLSLYVKLTQNNSVATKNSFLLESVVGGERFGRYSFIGLPARTRVQVSGFGPEMVIEVITDGEVVEQQRGTDALAVNPLDFIAAYQKRFKVALPQHLPEGLPRFCGGLAGYFGYDTVRYIERKLLTTCPPDELNCPDIVLLQCEELAVIDNLSGKLTLIAYANPDLPNAYDATMARLSQLALQLQTAVNLPTHPHCASLPLPAVVRRFAKTDYTNAVLRAQQLIAQGDFMQVQVGQRIEQDYSQSPLSLYRALRVLNPSPYMYYYDLGDFQIVGASPEILVRQETILNAKIDTDTDTDTDIIQSQHGTQKITIRPLAGTRPRGATTEDDHVAEQQLLADPKERAEHVMLIDLARNDIGRIAELGSVRVTEAFVVERYSHVMHIVSNVEGILCKGTTTMDVLKASFPAGTLTGAPKVHAMEVIDELEPVKRGIYGGACGYLSFAGDMDVAIAIRTGIVKNKKLYVQASAGVVADSVPELEWAETEAKARALLKAAEMVHAGLI